MQVLQILAGLNCEFGGAKLAGLTLCAGGGAADKRLLSLFLSDPAPQVFAVAYLRPLQTPGASGCPPYSRTEVYAAYAHPTCRSHGSALARLNVVHVASGLCLRVGDIIARDLQTTLAHLPQHARFILCQSG